MNGCISSENITRSYFRTRLASCPTSAIILIHNPDPFRDSLRSSQAGDVINVTLDLNNYSLSFGLNSESLGKGEIGRGAKQRATSAISSHENCVSSYFGTRHASSVTNVINLTHHPHLFRDSLRSSQPSPPMTSLHRLPTLNPSSLQSL